MTKVSTASRPGRKAKGDGHERRGEILAAAERIFVEKGYEGATIRKIADEVGLSSTALYMHFSDKGEILNEICRAAFESLLQRQLACAASGDSPLACVRDLAKGYVSFGFTHPSAYRLAFMMPTMLSADGGESVAQKTAAQLYANFEAAISAAIDAGALKGDPKIVAQGLWASVHGLVSLIITKPHFAWADKEKLLESHVEALLKGYGS